MIEPVNPEAIDADPSVRHSFQADLSFQIIHESSIEARAGANIAPSCAQIAGELSEEAGFPPLDRIIATSNDSRFMIFSLVSEGASPPGPRIFGLTTDPAVRIDDAVRFIHPLL